MAVHDSISALNTQHKNLPSVMKDRKTEDKTMQEPQIHYNDNT